MPAVAQINPKISEYCLNAKDFAGCVKTLSAEKNTDFCLRAKDFEGCMKTLGGQRPAGSPLGQSIGVAEPVTQPQSSGSNKVAVPAPEPYFYERDSVAQMMVRGAYGRYITFVGKTTNAYAGTDGSPGSLNCTTIGGTTTCNNVGYVAPQSGGVQNRRFRYELDCLDRTYNLVGDLATASGWRRGWAPVDNDPVAESVANQFCPIIGQLPKASPVAASNSLNPGSVTGRTRSNRLGL